uniref:Uncharacterized protein n=1 Tax=Salix viminalis TaxID=40686 RepID=A0A6N2NG65_SALVM
MERAPLKFVILFILLVFTSRKNNGIFTSMLALMQVC